MKYILMSYKENDLSKETLQAISEINGTNYVELTEEELKIIKADEYIWAVDHNLGVDSIEYKLAEKIRKVLE